MNSYQGVNMGVSPLLKSHFQEIEHYVSCVLLGFDPFCYLCDKSGKLSCREAVSGWVGQMANIVDPELHMGFSASSYLTHSGYEKFYCQCLVKERRTNFLGC